jgi:GTPase
LSIDITKYPLQPKPKYEIEYDYGNIEYKLKLCDVDINRIEELTTQMKFRLEEGNGDCYYEIGVEDNGNPLGISKDELEISVNILALIATNLHCNVKIVKLEPNADECVGVSIASLIKNLEIALALLMSLWIPNLWNIGYPTVVNSPVKYKNGSVTIFS